MKRALSIGLVLSLLLTITTTTALAEENTTKEVADESVVYVDGTLYDENGNVITKENPVAPITPRASLIVTRNSVYQYTTGEQIIEYLTDAWVKASEYTMSKTTTLSATGTATGSAKIKNLITMAFGVSLTKSTSFSVGYTIPANASRDSKLVHKADFDVYDCEVWEIIYTQDEILSETKLGEGGYEKPSDNYIRVLYR